MTARSHELYRTNVYLARSSPHNALETLAQSAGWRRFEYRGELFYLVLYRTGDRIEFDWYPERSGWLPPLNGAIARIQLGRLGFITLTGWYSFEKESAMELVSRAIGKKYAGQSLGIAARAVTALLKRTPQRCAAAAEDPFPRPKGFPKIL